VKLFFGGQMFKQQITHVYAVGAYCIRPNENIRGCPKSIFERKWHKWYKFTQKLYWS